MKPINLRLMVLAAGALIAGGFGSAANAVAPTFTVTPSAVVAGAPGSFVANNFSGLSSELLTITSPTTVSGSGWVQVGQFSCTTVNPPCTTGTGGLPAAQTGLTNSYGLFIEFSLTDHLTGGSLGLPGSSYTLDSLNFTIVLDPNPPFPHPPGDTVTTASVSPLTNATVNDLTGDDIVLAAGSLISGTAGIGLNGLAANLNSVENFLLCTGNGTGTIGSTPVTGGLASPCTNGDGRAFFSAPPVFFQIAFDGFTCTGLTSNCIALDGTATGDHIAINNAVGTVDFGTVPVPEPASLALFGIGVLAFGWLNRRRQKNLFT